MHKGGESSEHLVVDDGEDDGPCDGGLGEVASDGVNGAEPARARHGGRGHGGAAGESGARRRGVALAQHERRPRQGRAQLRGVGEQRGGRPRVHPALRPRHPRRQRQHRLRRHRPRTHHRHRRRRRRRRRGRGVPAARGEEEGQRRQRRREGYRGGERAEPSPAAAAAADAAAAAAARLLVRTRDRRGVTAAAVVPACGHAVGHAFVRGGRHG